MATEKRLINANRLKKRMIAFATAIKREYLSIEGIVDTINTEDTVDAVEVVHGEWSTIEDDYCGLIALQCSECNAEWWFEDDSSFEKYSYCPNCGAKMDK